METQNKENIRVLEERLMKELEEKDRAKVEAEEQIDRIKSEVDKEVESKVG
jgi:hypothetical protein